MRFILLASAMVLAALPASADDIRLDYLGHIRVPKVPWAPEIYEANKHFGYSRGAFCYLPERDTFLLMGHPYSQLFAEISNPGPGHRATLKSDFFDVTDGQLDAHQQMIDAQIYIHSLLYDHGRVLVSAEKWYNVQGSHIATHGSFVPDQDNPQFEGWWRIGDWSGQMTGYYMTRIPDTFAHGGFDLLTGGSTSWRAGSSAGPCAVLADVRSAAPRISVPSRHLLSYEHTHDSQRKIRYGDPAHRGRPLARGGVDGWMGKCSVGGVTCIGNRLVYFGRQGLGFDFYGTTAEYERLTGLPEAFDGKGYHCGPYEAAMWIYNMDSLLKGDPRHLRLTFPWALNGCGQADLRNACVHGDKLYLCEAFAEKYGHQPLPVIHVLRIHSPGDE